MESTMKNKYYGIGGWLIFVLLGLIITTVTNIYYVISELILFFEPDTWESITTYGSELYHPLFAPFIIFEVFFNLIMSVGAIILVILMLRKSHLFPKLMILYLIGAFILQFVDMFLGYKVYFGVPIFEDIREEAFGEILSATFGFVIYMAIWIPYFIKSKRVKATFLNKSIVNDYQKEEIHFNND